jgi:hypothetical protein
MTMMSLPMARIHSMDRNMSIGGALSGRRGLFLKAS